MNILCLHHNDADGRAAAAIVRRALGQDIWLYEMDYGDSLPLERVLVSDHIIIVDFSLPLDEMMKLASYHQFTWIDHHKSAIDEMDSVADNWDGIRDTSEAACVLTWKYYYPDLPVPRAVTLIGDRDIWRWSEKDTGAFNEGLYQIDNRPLNDSLWTPLLDDDSEAIERIIAEGSLLRDARLRDIRRLTSSLGYAVSFDGHRTLAINTRGSGDLGQHVRGLGYDIAYCYIDKVQNGTLYTYVTLYSESVDVSVIAASFGGGGHAGAAGFHFERGDSPFPPGIAVQRISTDLI